jgi:putative FmdB family regulatory protein
MPLYEYECNQCRRRTEKIQKYSDPEITVCPHCGGPLERTLTAPNVQFKGGGWYKDLYSSVKPPANGGAGGESGAPAAAASESGRDSSPAPSKDSGSAAPAASNAPSAAAPASAVAPAATAVASKS